MDEPQAQAGELKQSAQKFVAAKFPKDKTLSPAENLMLEKAAIGELADCSTFDDKECRIHAQLVVWLCTNESAQQHVHPRGIRVQEAEITGPLDLSSATIPFPLTLRDCSVQDSFTILNAAIPQLD